MHVWLKISFDFSNIDSYELYIYVFVKIPERLLLLLLLFILISQFGIIVIIYNCHNIVKVKIPCVNLRHFALYLVSSDRAFDMIFLFTIKPNLLPTLHQVS